MKLNKHLAIGFATSALIKNNQYANKTFAQTILHLENHIDHNQICIYIDDFKQFSGLALWTSVSEDVNKRLLRDGITQLQPKDINTGNKIWIIEICALNGSAKRLIRIFHDQYLNECQQVNYSRIKNGKRIVKRISRTDCTSFFQSSAQTIRDNGTFIQSHRVSEIRHAKSAAELAAQTLGEVAVLARHIPEIGNLPFTSAMERLVRPLNLHQYQLYRDTDGQLIGYVAWAWLDSNFASQDIPLPQALAPHQWNEGSTLLICDAFVTHLGLAAARVNAVLAQMPLTRIVIAHRPQTIASAQRQYAMRPVGLTAVDSSETSFSHEAAHN
jgi:hemolysin-activating ACP:hemolysin acyltransferase